MSRENAGDVQIFFGFLKYVCEACDFGDFADRSHGRGAQDVNVGWPANSRKGSLWTSNSQYYMPDTNSPASSRRKVRVSFFSL